MYSAGVTHRRKHNKKLSPRQLDLLVSFMESDLREKKISTLSPKEECEENKRKWRELTEVLNAEGSSVKSEKGWKYCWKDQRRNVKLKAAKIKTNCETSGPYKALTDIDLRILRLLDEMSAVKDTVKVPTENSSMEVLMIEDAILNEEESDLPTVDETNSNESSTVEVASPEVSLGTEVAPEPSLPETDDAKCTELKQIMQSRFEEIYTIQNNQSGSMPMNLNQTSNQCGSMPMNLNQTSNQCGSIIPMNFNQPRYQIGSIPINHNPAGFQCGSMPIPSPVGYQYGLMPINFNLPNNQSGFIPGNFNQSGSMPINPNQASNQSPFMSINRNQESNQSGSMSSNQSESMPTLCINTPKTGKSEESKTSSKELGAVLESLKLQNDLLKRIAVANEQIAHACMIIATSTVERTKESSLPTDIINDINQTLKYVLKEKFKEDF